MGSEQIQEMENINTFYKTIEKTMRECNVKLHLYYNTKSKWHLTINEWVGVGHEDVATVSYTHLDVYKRQGHYNVIIISTFFF